MLGYTRPCRKVSAGPNPTVDRDLRVPQLILTLILIAIGWFLLIRPQQTRIRAQRAMVESLEVGDRVITAGGIHGVIEGIGVETVQLRVAPTAVVEVARAAIMRRLENDPTDGAAGLSREDEVTNGNDEVAPGDEAGQE